MSLNKSQKKSDDYEEELDFQDELNAGTKLLGGQYTITKFLNHGGFGITYLAKDSLNRDVVIKECFPDSICRRSRSIVRAKSRVHQNSFSSIVDLFIEEARSQAKLVHPNIAGVHQVFNDNDTAYMAIDYINGSDLLDVIEKGEALSPEVVEGWLRKMLGAVSFIHEKSILHRDISPDNILIDENNEPILIDFGAAREQASKKSRALSTLRVVKDGYSPQEFYIAGSKQEPSSDLYALAATFYHVISGDAPPNSQERLAAIATDQKDTYLPLAGRFEGYSPRVLEAIDKALSVLPKDRLASAQKWLAIMDGKEELPAAPKENAPKENKGEKEDKKAAVVAKTEAPQNKTLLYVGAGGVAVSVLAIALMAFMSGDGSDSPETAQGGETQLTPPPEDAKEGAQGGIKEEAKPDAQASAPLPEPVSEPDPVQKEQSQDTAARGADESTPPTTDAADLSQDQAAAPSEEGTAVETKAPEAAAAAQDTPATTAASPDGQSGENAAVEKTAAEGSAAQDAADAQSPAPAAPEVNHVSPAVDMANLVSPEPETSPSLNERSASDAKVPSALAKKGILTQQDSQSSPPGAFDTVVPEIKPSPAETGGAGGAQDASEQSGQTSDVESNVTRTDGGAELRWTADLPFNAVGMETSEGVFGQVVSVRPDMDEAMAEWLRPGVVIYEIDGQPVRDTRSIKNVISSFAVVNPNKKISVSALVKGPQDDNLAQKTLTLDPTREVELSNGVVFRARIENGNWRSRVVNVPPTVDTDLKVGDLLVAEIKSGIVMNDSDGVERVIQQIEKLGTDAAYFSVSRDGSLLSARLGLD